MGRGMFPGFFWKSCWSIDGGVEALEDWVSDKLIEGGGEKNHGGVVGRTGNSV